MIEGRQGQQAKVLTQQVMHRAAGREVVALHHLANPQVHIGAHLGLDEVATGLGAGLLAVAAGGDGSCSWAWLRRSFRLHLSLRFWEEELDEVAVLPLGDAIPDGAGIARHLEVLAEGFGQRLATGLV